MKSDSSEGFELTDHLADVGIRSWAPTRERALELACLGLVSIMTDPDSVQQRIERVISVDAGSERDVLRRALSEVLFVVSSQDLFFSSFEVSWGEQVTIVCRGEPIDPDRHERYTEVKAITPSNLSFSLEEQWTCSVLVDV